jgi:outer membrane protein assembly factor BamB
MYWGSLAVIVAALPVAARQNPPSGQAVPAPATPRTQDVVWSRPLTAPAPQHLTFTDSILVSSGRETSVQAFALADGAPQWTSHVQATFAPIVADAMLLVPTTDALSAVRLTDGSMVWTTTVRARVAPILRGGSVFVASDAEVVHLRVTDGAVLARTSLSAAPTGGLAASADAIFVPLEDHTLLRLDGAEMTVAWRARLEGTGTSILTANDRVYVTLMSGGVAAHAQDSGDFQWIASDGFPIVGAAATGSFLYLAQLDTSLRALHAGNGHQAWREVAPRRTATGPLLTGSHLCAGLIDGAVACWDLTREPPGKPALLPVPDTPTSGPPLNPRLHALAISAKGQLVARILANFQTEWWVALVRRVDEAAR